MTSTVGAASWLELLRTTAIRRSMPSRLYSQRNSPSSGPEIGRPNHCCAALRGSVGKRIPGRTRSSRMASTAFVILSVKLRPGFVARFTVELFDRLFPSGCHRSASGPNGLPMPTSERSPTSRSTLATSTDDVVWRRAWNSSVRFVTGLVFTLFSAS